MANSPRKVSAKALVSDINAGMTDSQLIQKYQINGMQLKKLLEKLVEKELIQLPQIRQRLTRASSQKETIGRGELYLRDSSGIGQNGSHDSSQRQSGLTNEIISCSPETLATRDNSMSVWDRIGEWYYQVPKHQPDRKDLLVNKDWGIAKKKMSKKDAKGKGYVLFKGRWVTKPIRDKLKAELKAYSTVRAMAIVYWGLPTLILIILGLILLWKKELLGLASVMLSALTMYLGQRLWRYKRWAFYTTQAVVFASVLLFAIFTVLTLLGQLPFIAAKHDLAPSDCIVLLVVNLVFIVYFFRSYKRNFRNPDVIRIFEPPKEFASSDTCPQDQS